MKIVYSLVLSAVIAAMAACQPQSKNAAPKREEVNTPRKQSTFADFKKVAGVENVAEVPFQLSTTLDSIHFFVTPTADSDYLKIAYNKLHNYYGFEEFGDFYSIHYSINNNISNSIQAFVLKSEFTAAFDLSLKDVDLYLIRSSLFKEVSDLNTKSFKKYGSITEVSEREFSEASKNSIDQRIVKNPQVKLKDGNWTYVRANGEVVIIPQEIASTEDGSLYNEYIGQSPYLHLEIFKEQSVEVLDTYYSFYLVKDTANFSLYTAGYPQILTTQKWISYIASNDDVGSDFEVGQYLEHNSSLVNLLYVNFANFKIADEKQAFWADSHCFYATVYPLNSASSKGKAQKTAFVKIQLKANLF